MSEQITIPKETAQRLFDALVNSMDFGSGFLETDDVEALRGLAVALGVDPATGTPGPFKAKYPHAFDGETDRMTVGYMFGALINEALMPDYIPCKFGQWGAFCMKPETDPIHD